MGRRTGPLGVLFIVLVSVAFVASPLAAAHPHKYVGGTAEFMVNVCDDPGRGVPGIGGVCIPPNHMPTDSQGRNTITIVDSQLQPISGIYCQDADFDGLCGDAGDPRESFCDSLTVGPWNWNPSLEVRVMPYSPVLGNPIHSPCHVLSEGSVGSVFHVP